MQHPHLRGAQAVAIGKQEDSVVAFGVYDIEQAAHFILRQEIDGGRRPAMGRGIWHMSRFFYWSYYHNIRKKSSRILHAKSDWILGNYTLNFEPLARLGKKL